MLGLEADMRDDYVYEEGVLAQAKALASTTEKPCFFYSSFGQTYNRSLGGLGCALPEWRADHDDGGAQFSELGRSPSPGPAGSRRRTGWGHGYEMAGAARGTDG